MIAELHAHRTGLVALFTFLFFFFGCGGSDERLPDQAAAALAPQVEAIRAAATAGDRTAAQAGVDQLRAQLTELRGAALLDEDDAAQVLDAVAAVEARLALLAAPTTTTTTVPPPPPAAEPDRGDDDGDGKGKGNKDKDDDD